MPSNSCTITFNDNPLGVYIAGQKLSGKAVLITSKKQTVKKISITIQGYAKTYWTEGTGDDADSYSGHEDYLHSELPVKTSPNGNYFELLPAKYEFNFELMLPAQLPGSYTGRNGKVKYKVLCTVERYLTRNYSYPQPFTVVSKLDLNTNPLYRQPINIETNQKFHLMCCFGNGGRMYIAGHIPVGGFIPGEDIPVKVFTKNSTGFKCISSIIRFVEMAEFRNTSKKRTKIVNTTLMEKEFGKIKKSEIRELSYSIKVPPIPASTFDKCGIIELSYYIEVYCKMSGFHHNISLKMPITIGTVSLNLNRGWDGSVISTQPVGGKRYI